MNNNTQTLRAKIARKDFNQTTLRALAIKGITIVDAAINGDPNSDERYYQVVKDGTSMVRSHNDLLKLASN
jgi:hypothetical protein